MSDHSHSVDPGDRPGLDRPATTSRMVTLRQADVLSDAAMDRAIRRATEPPSAASWRRFLDAMLLGVGTLLVLAAAVYFFAFNWDELGRLTRFSIIGIAILASVGVAWFAELDGLAGRIAVTVASVLVGVLIAVQGQAYQSGADSWRLFAAWTVIVLPWAAAARFAPLWALTLILGNVALWQYWSPGGFDLSSLDLERTAFHQRMIALAVVNGTVLAAWERWGRSILTPPPAPGRWIERLLAIGVLGPLTLSISRWILESIDDSVMLLAADNRPGQAGALLWLLALAAVIFVYRTWREDLVPLALGATSVVIVATATLGRFMLDERWRPDDEVAIAWRLLVLAIALLTQVAVAMAWLRAERNRMEGPGASRAAGEQAPQGGDNS